MPDELFLVAARTLAGEVSADRLASGAVYPRVEDLRPVTRAVALAVAEAAVASGLAGIGPDTDVEAAIDGAMWWPDYVPYEAADQATLQATDQAAVRAAGQASP